MTKLRALKSTDGLCHLSRTMCRQYAPSVQSQHHNDETDKEGPARCYVALTREEGNNEKLQKKVEEKISLRVGGHPMAVVPIELPCIAHADGPDYPILRETLRSGSWDYVVVTSPEAARVLISALEDDDAGSASSSGPTVTLPLVAAVGKATEQCLASANMTVAFRPSKATAQALAEELPIVRENMTVLYPASQKAQSTLEDGLQSRGVAVTRLNTYDTVTASWTDENKFWSRQVKVACFASPSAVKGWLHNTNTNANQQKVLAACIGETSAEACRKLGWSNDSIFYPDLPGIDGWVEAIEQALNSLQNEVSKK